MELYKIKIIIICFCWHITSYSYSQNLAIKSVSLLPNDQTAIQHICFDNNGDTCALFKIKTNNLEGVEFTNPNQYIKSDYSGGEYLVYVPALSRKLDIAHKDYLPIQLDMSEYGYRKLRKGKTYLIILDAPKKTDLKSTIVIKVEPKHSKIILDNQDYEAHQNGTFEFSVKQGIHSYMVTAPNYHSQNGSVTVGKSEVKTLSVRLHPITCEILIRCNVDKARVFVDNIDYGQVGNLKIPQGEHNIRLQADGYVDSEQKVIISSTIPSLFFELKKNKRVTHIHATPVTIYSESSSIYKNNKEIKEWKNGATIMFLPGEYQLSDERGNKRSITVDSEPMVVKM